MIELIFKLIRPARKEGGDRYEATLKGESKPFVIYIPQSISRASGVPFDVVNITIFPKVHE